LHVNIRRARSSDLGEVIGMIEDHADFERASINTTGLHANLMQAMQGEKPRLCIFVAEVNHKLLGYCSLTQEWGRDYIVSPEKCHC